MSPDPSWPSPVKRAPPTVVEETSLATTGSVRLPAVVDWQNPSRELVDLVKTSVCPPGTTDPEFALFLYHAKRMNLDPLSRQVYLIPYGAHKQVVIGVDGFRWIAERSGQFDGEEHSYSYRTKEGTMVKVVNDDYPSDFDPTSAKLVSCTSVVYRKDMKLPFRSTAFWDEFVVKDKMGAQMYNWTKMPHIMLHKVALCQSIRAAFPNMLSGVYSVEELRSGASKSEDANAIDGVKFEAPVTKPIVNTTATTVENKGPAL